MTTAPMLARHSVARDSDSSTGRPRRPGKRRPALTVPAMLAAGESDMNHWQCSNDDRIWAVKLDQDSL